MFEIKLVKQVNFSLDSSFWSFSNYLDIPKLDGMRVDFYISNDEIFIYDEKFSSILSTFYGDKNKCETQEDFDNFYKKYKVSANWNEIRILMGDLIDIEETGEVIQAFGEFSKMRATLKLKKRWDYDGSLDLSEEVKSHSLRILADKDNIFEFYDYHLEHFKENAANTPFVQFIDRCKELLFESLAFLNDSPQHLLTKKYFKDWAIKTIEAYGLNPENFDFEDSNNVEISTKNDSNLFVEQMSYSSEIRLTLEREKDDDRDYCVYFNYLNVPNVKGMRVDFIINEKGQKIIIDENLKSIINRFQRELSDFIKNNQIEEFERKYPFWNGFKALDVFCCELIDCEQKRGENNTYWIYNECQIWQGTIAEPDHYVNYNFLNEIQDSLICPTDEKGIFNFFNFHLEGYHGNISVKNFILNAWNVTYESMRYLNDSLYPLSVKKYFKNWARHIIEEYELNINEFDFLTNMPQLPQPQNEETDEFKEGDLWDKLALIHYLNKHKLLKLDTLHQDNTKIASVLSFLIGNSSESIRQKLSRVRKYEFNPSLKNLENILPIVKILEHKEMRQEIETEIKKLS